MPKQPRQPKRGYGLPLSTRHVEMRLSVEVTEVGSSADPVPGRGKFTTPLLQHGVFRGQAAEAAAKGTDTTGLTVCEPGSVQESDWLPDVYNNLNSLGYQCRLVSIKGEPQTVICVTNCDLEKLSDLKSEATRGLTDVRLREVEVLVEDLAQHCCGFSCCPTW